MSYWMTHKILFHTGVLISWLYMRRFVRLGDGRDRRDVHGGGGDSAGDAAFQPRVA